MRLSGQILFGLLIILFGVLLLISSIFDIHIWSLCWPVALILIGLWLIFRPRFESRYPNVHLLLFGDYHRQGEWEVSDREHWAFVGDYKLNLQQASLPSGATRLRFYGFVQDITLTVPEDVDLSVSCTGFVSELNFFGEKRESFIFPLEMATPGYASADKKLRLESYGFVSTLKVKRPPVP